MSKAFTKEDGGEDVPLPVRAQGPKRPITKEGYRTLAEELATLQGPLPEEASVLEADVRRRERNRRALTVAALLDGVQVVEPPDTPDTVVFGVWVTLEDADGAEVTYRLVGSDEADAREGRLSVESPLARALLGREVGDSVVVERPRGALEYTVVRVDSREH